MFLLLLFESFFQASCYSLHYKIEPIAVDSNYSEEETQAFLNRLIEGVESGTLNWNKVEESLGSYPLAMGFLLYIYKLENGRWPSHEDEFLDFIIQFAPESDLSKYKNLEIRQVTRKHARMAFDFDFEFNQEPVNIRATLESDKNTLIEVLIN